MSQSKSKVLTDLASLLCKQALHFDEERIHKGDVVKWETWPITEKLSVNPMCGTCSVNLTENDENTSLKSIIIEGLDSDALVLKPDHFAIRHFAATTWNKACDYVIFTKFNSTKYAIFVELKTLLHEELKAGHVFSFSQDEDKKIAWQFLGSNAAIDNIIHNLARKNFKKFTSSSNGLSEFAKSDLYKYKRRYLILYKKINSPTCTTGKPLLTNLVKKPVPTPNIMSLEANIHAMDVDSGKKYSIGDLFSLARLEP